MLYRNKSLLAPLCSCTLTSLILYTASLWVLRAVETSLTGQPSFPESSLVMPNLEWQRHQRERTESVPLVPQRTTYRVAPLLGNDNHHFSMCLPEYSGSICLHCLLCKSLLVLLHARGRSRQTGGNGRRRICLTLKDSICSCHHLLAHQICEDCRIKKQKKT